MASTAAKIGIGCAVALVLGVLLAGGGGWYWWRQYGGELVESVTQGGEEGRAYGRGGDERKCLEETLARYRREGGMGGAIKARVFLKSCLETSAGAPDFCQDVPQPTAFTRSAEWAREKCEAAGLAADQFCTQLFQEVQEYCVSDAPAGKQQRPTPATEGGDDWQTEESPTPTPPRRARPPAR